MVWDLEDCALRPCLASLLLCRPCQVQSGLSACLGSCVRSCQLNTGLADLGSGQPLDLSAPGPVVARWQLQKDLCMSICMGLPLLPSHAWRCRAWVEHDRCWLHVAEQACLMQGACSGQQ